MNGPAKQKLDDRYDFISLLVPFWNWVLEGCGAPDVLEQLYTLTLRSKFWLAAGGRRRTFGPLKRQRSTTLSRRD